MNDTGFRVGAEGVDVDALMREVRETVARKLAEGAYADVRVARAERTNLSKLKDQSEFFALYLESLRDAVFVDINDFPIHERRRLAGPLLVRLKKAIWGLLKFYTYRLWSQQNEVNGLLLSLAEELDAKHTARIQALEKRIAELESRRPPGAA